MARTLTASDRSALIRLAVTLPAGSGERRAILKGLDGFPNRKSGGHVGDSVKTMLEGALRTTADAQDFLSRNGVSGALARSVEDAATALEKAVREAASTGL